MVFLKGSGTHKGKFQGFPSTHKSVKIRSAHLYKLKDKKIIGHWGVVDQLNFLKQTGVLLSERANEEIKDAKMVWIRDYSSRSSTAYCSLRAILKRFTLRHSESFRHSYCRKFLLLSSTL